MTPMTSDSRAASTTWLVTTERWLMSRIRWIWAISLPVRRKLPLVMRVIAADRVGELGEPAVRFGDHERYRRGCCGTRFMGGRRVVPRGRLRVLMGYSAR